VLVRGESHLAAAARNISHLEEVNNSCHHDIQSYFQDHSYFRPKTSLQSQMNPVLSRVKWTTEGGGRLSAQHKQDSQLRRNEVIFLMKSVFSAGVITVNSSTIVHKVNKIITLIKYDFGLCKCCTDGSGNTFFSPLRKVAP
ncbi:hypothetical protein OTU49_017216, partial [Cherax quadricarinatus]